jgi:hypothetical protein
MKHISNNENIAFHAARLLLLIALCGKPRSSKTGQLPGIQGRTLLAKLDFFLRYPAYLFKAAKILEINYSEDELYKSAIHDLNSVESRMIRYLYGPWDNLYYPVLAYLIGKSLIGVEVMQRVEIFRLTPQGLDVVMQLSKQEEYKTIVARANLVYKVFNKYSGSTVKKFIYEYFPEVVDRQLGAKI